MNTVTNDFGTIDILINNAGITMDTLLMRMTEQQWDTVINVNLKSVFNFTKAVQKVMLKAKSGSIVNLSSVVGVHGNAGQANYSASKAGIIGFTKSIARELGSRNIRCNAIAPGFIITEMTHKLPDEVREEWIKKMGPNPIQRIVTPCQVIFKGNLNTVGAIKIGTLKQEVFNFRQSASRSLSLKSINICTIQCVTSNRPISIRYSIAIAINSYTKNQLINI